MEVSIESADAHSPKRPPAGAAKPGPVAVWEEEKVLGTTGPEPDTATGEGLYGGKCQRSAHTEWQSHSGIGYGQLQLGWRLATDHRPHQRDRQHELNHGPAPSQHPRQAQSPLR